VVVVACVGMDLVGGGGAQRFEGWRGDNFFRVVASPLVGPAALSAVLLLLSPRQQLLPLQQTLMGMEAIDAIISTNAFSDHVNVLSEWLSSFDVLLEASETD